MFPHDHRTVLHDYPDGAGNAASSHAGAVQFSTPDGAIVESSLDHRRSFRGVRKWRRWSPADALYFFGYALTHYQGLPFTLADARPLGLSRGALRRGKG